MFCSTWYYSQVHLIPSYNDDNNLHLCIKLISIVMVTIKPQMIDYTRTITIVIYRRLGSVAAFILFVKLISAMDKTSRKRNQHYFITETSTALQSLKFNSNRSTRFSFMRMFIIIIIMNNDSPDSSISITIIN